MVCVASMAGSLAKMSTELERHLAMAETEQLLNHGELETSVLQPHEAYTIAKRANQLRVQGKAGL